MSNWTSVPVKKETRERLEKFPEKAGRDWDTFLRREMFGEEIEGSPVEPDPFPTADVKEAVREVLREELPEGALR